MKVTIEVDCTPEEARRFMGLPDLQPMQARVLAEVESRMMAEMARFSPDAALQTWLNLMPQSANQMGEAMTKLFTQGLAGTKPPGE